MKVWQIIDSFKAIHFKDRTILRSDIYLMSNDQRKSFLDLEVAPILIGRNKTNHYRVIEK